MAQINPFPHKDYREEALGRVTSQFEDADVFKRYLVLLLSEYPNILTSLKDLMQQRSIDTAGGTQLDIIGDIVGQERVLSGADLLDFFGFEGALNADTFGSLGSTLGGVFYSLGDSLGTNVRLTDEQYRTLIKAKIFKNSSLATPEDLISTINRTFNTTNTHITYDSEGRALVYIDKVLSQFEKVMLSYTTAGGRYSIRLIPKPIGVSLEFTSKEAE